MSDATELRDQIRENEAECNDHGAIIPTSLTAEDLCSIVIEVSTVVMDDIKL
jgi:hypothetical protein